MSVEYNVPLPQFLTSQLPLVILEELYKLRMFTEMEMHAVVYSQLRRFLVDRPDWYVRCNFSVGSQRPDIVLFDRYKPKVVLELGLSLLARQPYFNRTKAEKDRKKLLSYSKRASKGYLILVHDGPLGQDYSTRRGANAERYYYDEVLLNVRDFFESDYERWKKEWSAIRERHASLT
jgi:hypothetical protein